MMRNVTRLIAVCFTALFCTAASVPAQDFPSRQITIMVPVPPGGGSDMIARFIGQKLAASFGRTVIVENRPGASSTIGTEAVVRAQPDGHTLLYVASSVALMTTFYAKLTFDPRRDLAPITTTVSIPQILATHPSLPARNLKELLALAKAKAGALSYGSAGVGAAQHLAMELFKLRTGIDANHVPYRGAAPTQVSLLSGETQFGFLVIPLVQGHLKSGKLRGIGLSARKRSSIVPEIATLHELGIQDFEALQWHGMFAPVKVSHAIVERLNREIVNALSSPDIKERLATEGAEIVGNTPKEFAAFFQAETVKWVEVFKRSGAKPE